MITRNLITPKVNLPLILSGSSVIPFGYPIDKYRHEVIKDPSAQDRTILGPKKVFDGDPIEYLAIRIENNAAPENHNEFSYGLKTTFNVPIGYINHFKIKLRGIKSGNITTTEANGNTINTSTISTDGSTTTLEHFNFNKLPKSITISADANGYDLSIAAQYRFNIVEIEAFAAPLDVEFNDSVLDTINWNRSRYTGRQLTSLRKNEFNLGDISNDKTPIIQEKDRTFYLIGGVVSTNIDSEDTTVQNFENHSFIKVHTAITINEDGSIKKTFYNSLPNTNQGIIKKEGFKREFKSQFPAGSQASIALFDNTIDSSLSTSYNVLFNEGILEKLVHFRPDKIQISSTPVGFHNERTPVVYMPQSETDPDFHGPSTSYGVAPGINGSEDDSFFFASGSDAIDLTTSTSTLGLGFYPYTTTTFNSPSVQNFYSGSNQTQGEIIKPTYSSTTTAATILNFMTELSKHKENDYQNRRFFVSLLRSGSQDAVNTKGQDGGFIISNDLAQLSTFEITKMPFDIIGTNTSNSSHIRYGTTTAAYTFNTGKSFFNVNKKYQLNQRYDNSSSPEAFISGGYGILKLNEEAPAVLLDLNKPTTLPSGIGSKPAVLLPENLDPYIKDNLIPFLSRAGYDLGPISNTPSIDNTNNVR